MWSLREHDDGVGLFGEGGNFVPMGVTERNSMSRLMARAKNAAEKIKVLIALVREPEDFLREVGDPLRELCLAVPSLCEERLRGCQLFGLPENVDFDLTQCKC